MSKEIEALKKRIEELEAEVAKLKAAGPSHVIHSHYHYAQPIWANPIPCYPPQYPSITYGGGAGMGGSAG